MFLIDKYRPKNISESFFHKNLLELLEIMSKDEAIPHIIFYGPDGSGKKTLIKLFLQMLFDDSVNKLNDVEYEITGSGSKVEKELIKQSNYHIVIEPKNNNSDRFLIHDIVKEYAKRRSLGIFKTSRPFRIVLINNLDNLSYYAQASLRRTMEKYNDKCRFISRCKSLSKVSKPLQSRCICLRVPSPSDIELFGYIYRISAKENLKIRLSDYANIINKSNGNIKIALWNLEYIKFGYKMDSDYYNAICKVMNLLLQPILNNIVEIQNIIFTLTITNFNKTTIMRDILDKICMSNKITDEAKQKIIQKGAEIDYQMVKCRREIIDFKALIAVIMTILHEEKGLIKT